jgi:hypothetical protein
MLDLSSPCIETYSLKRSWVSLKNPDGTLYPVPLARLIALSHNNCSLQDKRVVCHACNNELCVNPLHLYLGTQKDNIQDQVDRGTWMPNSKSLFCVKGEKDGKVIYAAGYQRASRKTGVSPGSVSKSVTTGKSVKGWTFTFVKKIRNSRVTAF